MSSRLSIVDAIGGYFGLELPRTSGEFYPDAYRFQSARASFLALLLECRPACVWMPKYICNSMLEPLRQAGIACNYYMLDKSFAIDQKIVLKSNEWLLYVNYFGICGKQVSRVLAEFPSEQVVIDNSQAFYSAATSCLGTIYSPRKFFGVPDGGYLVTGRSITQPSLEDQGSYDRASHLVKRIAFNAEHGYADFCRAEDALSNLPPLRMSQLTQHILTRIDYRDVRQRRIENFNFLHDALAVHNQIEPSLDDGAVPLCYPLSGTVQDLAGKLASLRIFVPRYWPNISERCAPPSVEYSFVQFITPLPVDQRYGREELKIVVNHVESEIRQKR